MIIEKDINYFGEYELEEIENEELDLTSEYEWKEV